MTAFVVSMMDVGWRAGTAFPTGSAFLAASGAAFSAVVIGQMANAFACRSATRWPGGLGWITNRFVVYAVATELALLLGFLFCGLSRGFSERSLPCSPFLRCCWQMYSISAFGGEISDDLVCL